MNNFALYVATAFLTVIFTTMVVLAIVWHTNKAIDFDLRQTVVDSQTGKISIEKVGYMVALIISSWSLVTLTLTDKLTEWFFGAYMTAFAVARWGSQYLATKTQGTQNGNGTP